MSHQSMHFRALLYGLWLREQNYDPSEIQSLVSERHGEGDTMGLTLKQKAELRAKVWSGAPKPMPDPRRSAASSKAWAKRKAKDAATSKDKRTVAQNILDRANLASIRKNRNR